MTEEKKSREDGPQIEGVASNFVATLGLLDIILGGLALYCSKLLFAPRDTAPFPSTGFPVVDIALLTCAAALVGKIIFLLVSVVMAIIEWLRTKASKRRQKMLEDSLADYCELTGRTKPQREIDPLELATAYLATDTPAQAQSLDRIQTAAYFAYGASLLSIPFAIYLGRTTLLWLKPWVFAGSVSFFLLGLLQQLDFVANVTASLAAARPVSRNHGEMGDQTTHGRS